MSDFLDRFIRLGDISEIIMGQAPPGDTVTDTEIGVPFLQGCGEFGTKYPKSKKRCSSPTKICELNDILISVRAPVGELNRADQKYCIGRGLAAIRFKENFSQTYGWYLLEFSRTTLRKSAQGSTFEAVSRTDIKNLFIKIVPPHERSAIATILDTVDKTIQQTEAVIAKLKKVKAGMLHDLLTLGLDENKELRCPIRHPEQFKDSPLGRIPKKWTIQSLGEVLVKKPRNGFSPKEISSFSGAFVLGLGCLTSDGFQPRQLKSINTEDVQEENVLQDGDLLISRSNTSNLVALPGIYKDIGHLCTYPDLMMRLIPKSFILSKFMELIIRYSQLRDHLVRNANGTSASMVKINSATVTKSPIIYPDLPEQERILGTITPYNEKLTILYQEHDKLKIIKQALMQDLLTGKVRVPEKTYGGIAMTHSIPSKETLTIEFKSDLKRLPDRDLMETVVGMANTEGGSLYLGVEDDGRVTGLHPDHKNVTGLAAFIANRTSPPVGVRVELMEQGDLMVARIDIPKALRLTSSTDGSLRRRCLKQDNTPETVPFLPHEFATRQSDLGLLDYSAMPVEGAELSDFDPLERARLRQLIERYGGDATLLDLDDGALDGALGFTARSGTQKKPTVLGLLLLGRQAAMRTHLPTHEVAFQVLEGEDVRLNEFWRAPLLKAFELIETHFQSRNIEQEFQAGLFRVPVPKVDRRAFREALCNALTHRDYTRRGAVHVRWDSESLTISNPGGLVEGVTLENLLTTEPRPRNPALADAFKRIGLVERTGRGVDLIYRGMLRFGRELPDYSRSDFYTVVVRMSTSDADTAFLALVMEEENSRNKPLPIDSLIALSALRLQRRLNRQELAHFIQKNEDGAKRVLEALVERGLVQPHGAGRARSYTMSPRTYRTLGKPAEYTRQAGFDLLQQEQMVANYVRQHGEIRRKDVVDLCQLSPDQAYRLLKRLVEKGLLDAQGTRKGAFYTLGSK